MQRQATFCGRDGTFEKCGSERGLCSTRRALVALGALFLLLPATILAAYVLPSPVALMAPGPVEPLDSLIRVESSSYEPSGHLYLTTVRLIVQPRLGQYLLAQLQPDVEVVARGEALPSFLSHEEYRKLSQRLLEESQSVAQVVALRQAKCAVKVGNPRVTVVSTAPGTPAAEQLRPGDEILSADGEQVDTTTDLVAIVHQRVAGEPVKLNLLRNHEQLTVTLPTLPGPLDSEGPVLGVVAVTTGLDFKSPMDIKIESGPVAGGPSAGLMYALGVYNAVVTEDITRGHRIAGTGTLRLNGMVGPVDGVELKVRAAEQAGADYFLVPVENAAVARAAASTIKIVPVGSFQEALNAVRQIGVDTSHNPRVVPARTDLTLASFRPLPLPAK